ncbi:MAG: hypothetical protein ACRESY_02065, partial [Steroidobacteraceae bacterium]
MNAAVQAKPPVMWRRMALIIGCAVFLGLAAASWIRVHEVVTERYTIVSERLSGSAQSFARELHGRLESADALVRYLSATDAGADGTLLQDRMLTADAFHGVVVVPYRGIAAGDTDGSDPAVLLSSISDGDRLRLQAGQSLIRAVTPAAGGTALYLVHQVVCANAPRLGLFEIDPGWLWQGAASLPSQQSMTVIDPAAHLLYQGSALPPEIVRMVARTPAEQPAPAGQPLLRDWQQNGMAWRGAVVGFDTRVGRLSGPVWSIAAYGQLSSLHAAAQSIADDLLPLLLLDARGVALATWSLCGCWQRPLLRLEVALQGLRQGQFRRVNLSGSADTPRAIAQSFNLAMMELESRCGAHERLSEIDRLLLEATDLERSIEPILLRVCTVTEAQVAAMALLDRDAPAHARSFMAGCDGAICPVTRINLEPETTLALQDAPQGLLVPTHQLDRYGFLQPLRERGAEIFHVWPILAGSEVAGMLSVGYRGSME